MNKFVYVAVLAFWSSGFAQEPNRSQPQPNQPRPAQAQPEINQPPRPAITDTTPKTATERTTEGFGNIVTDWRLEDLPPAVQKTVLQQSGGQKIADIDRETRTGRTIWEVEFEKAGRNTEIHVADDGTLMPEGPGLTGRTTTADASGKPIRPSEPSTAAGTPAGTQTGRSGVALAMGTKWEDLPQAVQQKAMQFGGKEKVADIDREETGGKVAYEVEFRREGRNLEVHFGEDGAILESNDPSVAPAQGGSRGATQGEARGSYGRTDTTRSPSSSSTSPSTTQPARPQPNNPGQNYPERPTPPPQPNPNPNQPQP